MIKQSLSAKSTWPYLERLGDERIVMAPEGLEGDME